jgi:hypothetical protein
MSWKEHIRNLEEIFTEETPSPRLFEVIRYMLDKPVAIPKIVLENYIGESIEKAWNAIVVTLALEEMHGKESEWKNVQWVTHTDKEAVPYVSFATIDMGE